MIIVIPPHGDRRITTNAAITQQMTRKTPIPATATVTATATTTKASLLLSLKLQFHQLLLFVIITIIMIMTISSSSSASSSLLSSFYLSGTVQGVRTVGTRTHTRTTLPIIMNVVSAFTIMDSQRNRNRRHITTMTMKMITTTTTTTTTTPLLTYLLPPIFTTTTATIRNRLHWLHSHSYSHSYSSSSLSSLVSLSSSLSSSSSTDPTVETTTATPTIGTTTTAMMTRIPPNERAKLLNKYLDMILTTTTSTTKPLVVAGSISSNSNSDSLSTDNYTTSSISLDIMEAALQSFLDPSKGYNAKYGRPALRAYRSFIYPKQKKQQKENKEEQSNQEELDSLQLEGIARRTATQIDFLIKRQTSQRLEAIRNHDTNTSTHDNGFIGESDNNDNDTQIQTRNPTTTKSFPITIVLDNIRGAFNVGSIFRTGEACGVSSIITCGITPHPNGSGQEKVAKSALGADYLIHHTQHYATTQQALLDLKKSNMEINSLPPFVIALETTNVSQLYTDIDYRPYYNDHDHDHTDEQQQQQGDTDTDTDTDTDNSITKGNGRGIIVILGNEVTGVDAELLSPLLVGDSDSDSDDNSNTDNSDDHDNLLPSSSSSSSLVDIIIELPTYGRKNSLNVAAVAPVILYEILRQWNESK